MTDARFVRPLFFAAAMMFAVVVGSGQSLPLSPGLDKLSVLSDGHPMTVWARIPENPRGAVLLVHGRTWSSRPDFDLQVPGLHRSVMADLAAKGFAAYAVDQRGYGETPRDATGWLTPKRALRPTSQMCCRGSPRAIPRCRNRHSSVGHAAPP